MRKILSLLVIAVGTLMACGDTGTGGGETSSTTAGTTSSSSSGDAGGAGGAGGGGGAPVAVSGESSVVNDCAPNDGPARTLKIGLSARTCSATPSKSLLRMSFYTHIDSPAGNTWTFGGGSADAQGVYQPDIGDPSNIVAVLIGTLQITTWDGQSATGSYDVELVDGQHLVGLFDAIACLQEPALCG